MFEYWVYAALAVSWVSCALLVIKLDAVLCGNRTWEGGVKDKIIAFIIATIFWFPGVIYLLTCKHHINNGIQNDWDY